MKGKNILVFGASGQIGLHLIRRLTINNHMVTAVTRNLHQKGYKLKTQGNPGYIEVLEENIFDQEKLINLVKDKDICINLIGILNQKKNNTFQNIHVNFPSLLSQICKENGISQFIHLSALGIEEATNSLYAKSKLDGENEIKKNFEDATILRPSIVYSAHDNFTTNLMTLLNRIPVFPIYYSGKTIFMPIHCTDLAEIILKVIENNIKSEIIECVGPEEISFKEILVKLLKLIKKKRLLFPMPIFFANIFAYFLEKFPNPLLTLDQLKLLKFDNKLSKKYKSNKDIGINCELVFEKEVEKYCSNWREFGQFSK